MVEMVECSEGLWYEQAKRSKRSRTRGVRAQNSNESFSEQQMKVLWGGIFEGLTNDLNFVFSATFWIGRDWSL